MFANVYVSANGFLKTVGAHPGGRIKLQHNSFSFWLREMHRNRLHRF